MSTLNGKQILLVGNDSPLLTDFAKTLQQHEVKVHKLSCDEVLPEKLENLEIDLIILNHLLGEGKGIDVLNKFRSANSNKVVPIFVLVEDSNEKIQEAISYGATDYLTPQDDIDSILQKTRAVFEESTAFSNSAAIDITPEEATITKTGIKVFVVEDDPLLRNLLSIRLARSSFPSEFNSDGKNVIAAMKQFKPDVVVLDLMLPGISGFDILSQIKEDEKLSMIPVIVFSNRDGQEERRKAKQLGANAFYVKAMTDLSELIEEIESLVK